MAADASLPQPEGSHPMESDRMYRGCMVASTPYPSSMAWHSLHRQIPEVGARCVNCARRDLCGGHSVMGVPTAIEICTLLNQAVSGFAEQKLQVHYPYLHIRNYLNFQVVRSINVRFIPNRELTPGTP